MSRKLVACILFLCGSIVYAGGQEAHPIEIGRLFQSSSQGKLFSAKTKAGIDFKVWYSVKNSYPYLILDPEKTFRFNSLALGATFANSSKIYVLIQHEYNHNFTDQIIYSTNLSGKNYKKVVSMNDLGLQLAEGAIFKYQRDDDMIIFTAMRQEKDQTGNISQAGHTFSYGPLKSKDIKLKVIR